MFEVCPCCCPVVIDDDESNRREDGMRRKNENEKGMAGDACRATLASATTSARASTRVTKTTRTKKGDAGSISMQGCPLPLGRWGERARFALIDADRKKKK